MKNVGIFIDGENISSKKLFHLFEDKLKSFGNIIIKKIYCDFFNENNKKWNEIIKVFHFEPIHCNNIPSKNSSDIKMTIEIMECLFKFPHLDIFIIISSDSDFSPLVKKLKEYNKFVICIGESFTPNIIKENCNQFITIDEKEMTNEDKLTLIIKQIKNTSTTRYQNLSFLKDQIKILEPNFNEKDYGYSRFSTLIEEKYSKIIKIHINEDGGNKFIEFL